MEVPTGSFGSQNECYQLLTDQSGGVFKGICSGVCCSAFQVLTLELISDQCLLGKCKEVYGSLSRFLFALC